ncbi:histidine kinase osmosensor [Gryganskiella cystojenkinii]|nr:histidine kinase osmosensor [Gryganskiella cystojenkinii]
MESNHDDNQQEEHPSGTQTRNNHIQANARSQKKHMPSRDCDRTDHTTDLSPSDSPLLLQSPLQSTSRVSVSLSSPHPSVTSSRSRDSNCTCDTANNKLHSAHLEADLAVITDCPNATNAAQWFYKPYTQPSSIITTATSSLMIPSTPPSATTTTATTLGSGFTSGGSTSSSSTAASTLTSNSTSTSSSSSSTSSSSSSSSLSMLGTIYTTAASALAGGALPLLSTAGRDHHIPDVLRTQADATKTTLLNYPRTPASAGSTSNNLAAHNSIPQQQQQQQQPQQTQQCNDTHEYFNPYQAPSQSNSRSFIPPKLPGYEFMAGSQAGNMGLMMGKRLSNGDLVTGKLHLSQILLNHEHRILKRLTIMDGRFDPGGVPPPQFAGPTETEPPSSTSSTTTTTTSTTSTKPSGCGDVPADKQARYETGLVEQERYYNRVVEDFLSMEDNSSVLIMERLGPNLLSPLHHRFMGLEDLNGAPMTEADFKQTARSPFPDVYTFLIFCLKAACVLEGLQREHLAHLALCPTAMHWAPPPNMELPYPKSPPTTATMHEDESATNVGSPLRRSQAWDINQSKLRLFDFSHSKILSHERARAPNNIVEWQTPGFLEYHLQFLAPEQTGRAETWMDHRTDIYALGATLFSLLTMQFPNSGSDSVQILQEQKMISATILQAANAYQQSLHSDVPDYHERDISEMQAHCAYLLDHYVFEDEIVSLQNQAQAKIPLSSKTLLRGPKPFGGGKSIPRAALETTDPVVRVIFVSGPTGVGKTVLTRSMATIARNSGLFAGGVFEAENSTPYSAILSCVQSVLQQLLAQHTEALASLVIAIRTAFEPSSGIGIICDLIPELKYFFPGSDMPVSKDVPLTHSVARFHALILKLIRVISTHFFMTWVIDDLQHADENSLALLATLVNVNKRLPIILIITHTDTIDCLIKVKQILGGGTIAGTCHPSAGFGAPVGGEHHDPLVRDHRDSDGKSEKSRSAGHSFMFSGTAKSTTIRDAGLPLVVRGGGGVRFIRLQNPTQEIIQTFLGVLLHRTPIETEPLAKVLLHKSWLTIRQLVLELYRNETIFFHCGYREWQWQSCSETLGEVVRKLTGEECAFLEERFRRLDRDTKKTLICASICGPTFSVQDLQLLVSRASWDAVDGRDHSMTTTAPLSSSNSPTNKENSAMAGLQSALKEGILVYTSVNDQLKFHHGVMRKVALDLIPDAEETEKLHLEMAKILFLTPGQEFRTASHILHSLNLIKKRLADRGALLDGSRTSFPTTRKAVPAAGFNFTGRVEGRQDSGEHSHDRRSEDSASDVNMSSLEEEKNEAKESDMSDEIEVEIDTRTIRMILSHAGEKSQKSGAQDNALAYWKAAMSLLPQDCWKHGPRKPETAYENLAAVQENMDLSDADGTAEVGDDFPSSRQSTTFTAQSHQTDGYMLYHEALKLHLQCIEAERWRENFDEAMAICEIVLANTTDPIDRARAYQHQIEMSVWAYSAPDKATRITVQCLKELGLPEGTLFCPTDEEMRVIFDRTHMMLLEHMPGLQAHPPRICRDPRIIMIMEVLSIASASVYYCNVGFMASIVAQSMKIICDHGITKDTGRALVSFALTYSTWYGCLENAYELGKLACAVSNGNHHVKFLFYLTVQQWGDHIAHSIPALEETLTAVDLTCDRLFHTAGMIHVSVMRVLIGRVNLKDCMATTIDLLAKHVEFGPKSHGVEVMQGILQMIKCLKGRTLVSNPETIFDDVDYSEKPPPLYAAGKSSTTTAPVAGGGERSTGRGSKKKKHVPTVHNNSTYQMLKILAAFIYGHYAYIEEVTDIWHDDPKSIMNFEGSWITHMIFTVVGLTLVNLLRTETDPEVRKRREGRLFRIRDRMELRANKFPTNHAAMYYLLEAEIADQAEQAIPGTKDMKQVFLLYEKAIMYATEGDFPVHKCFAYELAGKCHHRHGLVTSAKCLLAKSRQGYQTWGASGKVQWFHEMYPTMFPSLSDPVAPTGISRRLIYRPSATSEYISNCPVSNDTLTGFNAGIAFGVSSYDSIINSAVFPSFSGSQQQHSDPHSSAEVSQKQATAATAGLMTSPTLAGSPKALFSPTSAHFEMNQITTPTTVTTAATNGASSSSTTTATFGHGNATVSGLEAALDSKIGTTEPSSGNMPGNMESSPAVSSASLSSSSSSLLSAPLYSIQNTWLSPPSTSSRSPELDVVDLDVLDFSSVIEAMQVIASEIDLDLLLVKALGVMNQSVGALGGCIIIVKEHGQMVLAASLNENGRCESVQPAKDTHQCKALFHGVINYVTNTSNDCLLTNAKDDPRFCSDDYLLRQKPDLKTVLCSPIMHKSVLVGVLYMENFPERAFANKRMLVMKLLVQQLGISITNALLYQSVLQSETKLNGLLENMPCGIAIWDATAENCLYINSSWTDMTGFTLTEILESGWRCLIHPDELVSHGLAWMERVLLAQSCQWQCRYALKDGTYRWGVVRMLPIMSPTEQNKIMQWLTVTIDIDDQRRAVQLKSNFLANMSHELRTPFSGILGMLSLLRDSSGLSNEQFEFVDMAKASCEMLIRIVDDLLNFSKLEADKVTLEDIPLCFEEIIGDVCDLLVPLASRKGLELIILVDNTLPLLLIGDPDRMKQILMNLIGNAIKFSTSGCVVIKYWHEKGPTSGPKIATNPKKSTEDGPSTLTTARREFSPTSRPATTIGSLSVGASTEIGMNAGTIYPYSSALGAKTPSASQLASVNRTFTTQEVLDSMSDKCKSDMANHPMMVQKLRMEAEAAAAATAAAAAADSMSSSSPPEESISRSESMLDSTPSKSPSSPQSSVRTTEDSDQYGYDINLHCSVQDQGIGMTPEEQKMLFVSFQQTDNGTTRKYGGTGLGLSICAQLIAHMKGNITVESEKGSGSTFTFTAKLRTSSQSDRDENPAETSRILQCRTVMDMRWAALRRRKRFLLLSPNPNLREQLCNVVPGAEYTPFSSVQEAVDAGVISLLEGEDAKESSRKGPEHSSSGSIEPFDFILVDHVLDSSELDRLWPTPTVAFVLLLQPTTETLRWILPPAEKRSSGAHKATRRHSGSNAFDSRDHQSSECKEGQIGVLEDDRTQKEEIKQGDVVHQRNQGDREETIEDEKDEEEEEEEVGDTDDGQADIGGRGRLRVDSSSSNFGPCVIPPGHATLGISRPGGEQQAGGNVCKPHIPSLLFKRKRYSSAYHLSTAGASNKVEGSVSSSRAPTSATAATTAQQQRAPSSSYQVCRMIKPVRRLKLLHIMYNAIVQHENIERGHFSHSMLSSPASLSSLDSGDGCSSSSTSDFCSEMMESDMDLDSMGYASSLSLTSTPAASSTGTLKRSRSRGDSGGDYDHKWTKHQYSPSSTSASLSSPGSSTMIGATDRNLPKRARNNDALTLLLTPEERRRCHGVNVLVAEDDFVSQKILEKQLSKLGMNVTIANNGQEAVERWMSVEDGFYTIAIFDHHMPIMDGLEATRKIRELEEQDAIAYANAESETKGEAVTTSKKKRRRIPIVGLSADIQLSTKEKCIKAGMDEYATKPLLTQGLALLIQRYCCQETALKE